jgi:iron complex outermembrane recepter protein
MIFRAVRVLCAIQHPLVLGTALFLSTSAAYAGGTDNSGVDAPVDQSTPKPADASGPDKPNKADQSADSLQEVTVTGTRIVTNGYAQPTPVTVASTVDLLKSTPSDIPDALNDTLPQFLDSSSAARSTHNNPNSGLSGDILNLRGVGGYETLILFDGIRMPPTTYLGSTDVDVLPEALVQRVDVVTGGASAVYGSDAVAGVVNFVLDKKFTGVKADFQGGTSDHADNSNYRLSLAGGTDLFGGDGHILASIETYHNNGMLRSQRSESNDNYLYAGSVPGSAAAPGSAANPYTMWKNTSIAISAPTGWITSGPQAGNVFTNNYTALRPFNPGTPTGSPGYYANNGDGLAIPSFDTAISPLDTKKAFVYLEYNLTPDIQVHVQGIASRSAQQFFSEANGFLPPTEGTIFSGNPYLPGFVQNALTGAGAQSFQMAIYPWGPIPDTHEATTFYQVAAGLNGKFGDGWTWNVDYDHARSKDYLAQFNTMNWANTLAAMDAVTNPATGQPACYASLSANSAIAAKYANCSPLNVFNPSATPAGEAYAFGTSWMNAINVEDIVDASLQGKLFALPAGKVAFSIGAEYRNQTLDLTSNSNPSLLETPAENAAYFQGLRGVPANTGAWWLLNQGTAAGSENVKEGFAELQVPLLKDLPLAKSMDFSAAGRYTDYSTSGSVKTWKLGLTYSPMADLLLRGTLSADIRAPTLFQLFAGPQVLEGQLYDPVTNKTANTFTVSSGSGDLKPERGRTLTYGGVYSPSYVPGLSVALDYYVLNITGAINSLSNQQIVNDCYTLGPTSPECALITRATPTSFPSQVATVPTNTAFLRTTGFDLDSSYKTAVGPGILTGRLYGNYLWHYISQQDATAPVYDFAGYGQTGDQPTAYPHMRGTLSMDYAIGPWDAFVSERMIGAWSLNWPQPDNTFVSPHVPAVFYTNTTITYKLPVDQLDSHVYLTVSNLFDKNFPLIPGTVPGLNLPTMITLYDQIGRAFTLGVNFKF